jgi:DNA-directed RNA polymerase subunit RPC12/RpoP
MAKDDTFICSNCKYEEKRLILGNTSSTPCPRCGGKMVRKNP